MDATLEELCVQQETEDQNYEMYVCFGDFSVVAPHLTYSYRVRGSLSILTRPALDFQFPGEPRVSQQRLRLSRPSQRSEPLLGLPVPHRPSQRGLHRQLQPKYPSASRPLPSSSTVAVCDRHFPSSSTHSYSHRCGVAHYRVQVIGSVAGTPPIRSSPTETWVHISLVWCLCCCRDSC